MAQPKEGSIRKRGNGTFEYRVYTGKGYKSFYGKTEAEVKRKYREYKKSLNINTGKEPEEEVVPGTSNATGGNITLDDYTGYWLKMYKYGTIAESTYDRLENIYVKHIKTSAIAQKDIRDVTSDDIQMLINSKKTVLSLSSIKKIKEVLYPCLKHAMKQNLITSNPAESVVIPKKTVLDEQEKRLYFYSDEEVSLIVQAMSQKYYQNNPRRYRYAPLFSIILNTGLRIGECMALNWDDVNINNKTLKVNKSVLVSYERDESLNKVKKKQTIGPTKTLKGNRVVPLNDSAIEAFQLMRERNEDLGIVSDLIFSNYEGRLLTIKSVQTTFKSICNDLGIVYKGLHALRHTFGSLLIKNHVDIKIVSELLGHTDVRFTYNRYIHIIQEQKAEAINLITITPRLDS